MCTAISVKNYFGRTLDVEGEYGQKILIAPRNFSFKFKKEEEIKNHYAIIGIGIEKNGYPLYFDGANEKGLSMAGLNFPHNANYKDFNPSKKNITPFEFIPYVLSLCKNTQEAREILRDINLVNISFDETLPLSPLHFIIADKKESIVVESVKEGLKVYENKIGAMTNNPPFPKQLENLEKYKPLSNKEPQKPFEKEEYFCRGMGGVGLPGDFSSMSRLVRASFVKDKILFTENEVGNFFNALNYVSMPKGCVQIENNSYEYTVYSDCYDLDRGLIYYTRYNNSRISMADMHKANLESSVLLSYKMEEKQDIFEHKMF